MAQRMNKFEQAVSMTSKTLANKNNTSVTVKDIDIDLIDFDPNNEYLNGYEDQSALDNSVKEIGMKSIIGVYEKSDGRYLCYSGHSRIMAAKNNNKTKITCQVEKEPENEKEKMKNLLYLNIQRQKRPLYIARNMKEYERILRSEGEKNPIPIIANAYGYSDRTIRRYISLLELPNKLQELCKQTSFPYLVLIKYKDKLSEEDIEELANVLSDCDDERSSKDVENLINHILSKEKEAVQKDITIDNTLKKVYKYKQDLDNMTIENKEEALQIAIEMRDYFEQIINICSLIN